MLQARDDDGSFVALRLATTAAGAEFVNREGRFLQALDPRASPVPRLAAAGTDHGRRYCAASWMPGVEARGAAAERREQGPPSEILDLCRQIARAYAALHAQGVAHGAVHPRHVLVDVDGSVALVDFATSASASDKPRPAWLEGRFSSLSAPEQAQSLLLGEDLTLTLAAEQYSVAALLYLLITGRLYARLRLERPELARDIVECHPASFTEHGAAPWPELEATLARALQKDPCERYASVDDLAQTLGAVSAEGDRVPCSRKVQAAQTQLTPILEAFRRDTEAVVTLPPPTCSVNLGAAGVAFALMRLGKTTADPTAFEHAEQWLSFAERRMADADAFADGEELTPRAVGHVSPYHTASGLPAVRAFLSDANGDRAGQQAALDDFRAATDAPCANLDLTLGRSSVLLVSALLYARAEPDWPAAQMLAEHADRLSDGIWVDLAGVTMPYYGVAHGWGGVAYASLMWARARGAEPPPGAHDVLNTLAGLAEPRERGARWPLTGPDGGHSGEFWPGWCHGNAGYVFLWNLAHATYGEDRFAHLAERAAWLADEDAGVDHLCCGAAGQAYAALNHYRTTGDIRWRARAVGTADRAVRAGRRAPDPDPPLSLYRGRVGLALLAVELECPEYAAMPLFEFEPGGQRRSPPGQSWGAIARCAEPASGITLPQLRQAHYQRRVGA